MEKRFCDICGKDITNNVIFELGIYDEILEEETFQRDMCKKCTKNIRKLIREQEKK